MPVVLYSLDQPQAGVPLVLSRDEAENLRDRLAALLSPRLVGVET
ncbi:hypothetical protein AB0910_21145 [Streptomyces sp. NPDC047002]